MSPACSLGTLSSAPAWPQCREGGRCLATSAARCSSKASCHFPSSSPAKSFLTSRLKPKAPDYRRGQAAGRNTSINTPPRTKSLPRALLFQTQTLLRPTHVPGAPGSFSRWSRLCSYVHGPSHRDITFPAPASPQPSREEPPAPAPSTCQG